MRMQVIICNKSDKREADILDALGGDEGHLANVNAKVDQGAIDRRLVEQHLHDLLHTLFDQRIR